MSSNPTFESGAQKRADPQFHVDGLFCVVSGSTRFPKAAVEFSAIFCGGFRS